MVLLLKTRPEPAKEPHVVAKPFMFSEVVSPFKVSAELREPALVTPSLSPPALTVVAPA